MLFSQSLEDRQISFFRSMLLHVLNGEESYKSLVDPIILDAHALATRNKNYFTIDRDSYHVIVYLVQKANTFFDQIDPKNLGHAEYQKINSIISEQRQLMFA